MSLSTDSGWMTVNSEVGEQSQLSFRMADKPRINGDKHSLSTLTSHSALTLGHGARPYFGAVNIVIRLLRTVSAYFLSAAQYCCKMPLDAIVIRGDVPDSEYRVSATAFPALAYLPGEGHGVLIARDRVVRTVRSSEKCVDRNRGNRCDRESG